MGELRLNLVLCGNYMTRMQAQENQEKNEDHSHVNDT